MRVNKRCAFAGELAENRCFVRLNGRGLSISAGARDLILPHRYVFVDITDEGDILLTPTNDESGFKITIINGYTKISASAYLMNAIGTNERISIKKREDGTLLGEIRR